ncbi:methylmalonyl-CoA mutase [Aureimonas sp. SA4125]|uniref:methylmalonyl-CoA mutase family protein n=1 Tax=Aureimonas sp. SA4125 TaxID=2826993 RepID=UPI001CC44037|nr:methylmalonyl-CoA mutase family protein [Aureimonas sp. SA4125]BDA86003.1 methylmalonyl-CoA mutase [Aureimonas sp. SA4125]
MGDNGVATQFADRNEAEWRAVAEKALAGAGFETLVSRSDDGIAYGPLYPRRTPAMPIAGRAAGTGWTIVQPLDDPDPSRANTQALVDLEAGAEALSLCFEGAAASRGFGLKLEDETLATALDGVLLDIVHIRVEPHPQGSEALAALLRLAARRGLSPSALSIDAGIDMVGPLAFSGRFPDDDRALRAGCGALARSRADDGMGGRTVEADGRVYHDAGASEAQELGAVLATAVWHLRALVGAGMAPGAAADAIGFTLAADQQQFLVMAKLRALRLLWRRVLDLSGVASPAPARLHVETSYRMMTAHDPHGNILRTTIAAFAAATGGADSIAVLPFTAANGLAEARARRLARNTQVILREEAGLACVADPSAGSGGVEALTDALARAGWDAFRQIETEGGIFASLKAGILQARIAETRQAREAEIAAGRHAIIGVTHYPLGKTQAAPLLTTREEARTGDAGDAPPAVLPLQATRLAATPEAHP